MAFVIVADSGVVALLLGDVADAAALFCGCRMSLPPWVWDLSLTSAAVDSRFAFLGVFRIRQGRVPRNVLSVASTALRGRRRLRG